MCNIARIRGAEGSAINLNSLQLGRKSKLSQISLDCEMRSPVQNLDPLLGAEEGGVSRIQVYLESDSKQYVGDVAGKGLELAGGERNIVPNHQSPIYVEQ